VSLNRRDSLDPHLVRQPLCVPHRFPLPAALTQAQTGLVLLLYTGSDGKQMHRTRFSPLVSITAPVPGNLILALTMCNPCPMTRRSNQLLLMPPHITRLFGDGVLQIEHLELGGRGQGKGKRLESLGGVESKS